MGDRSVYTLRLLLDEVRKELPTLKEGQVFETLKSIYPTSDKKRFEKNIFLEGVEMTKPLAVSKKAKDLFKRDSSPLYEFYKETKKGDYLKVVEVRKNGELVCENISLKDDIRKKYYSNDYIILTLEDILNGTVKQVKRNISKILQG